MSDDLFGEDEIEGGVPLDLGDDDDGDVGIVKDDDEELDEFGLPKHSGMSVVPEEESEF
jgi:hypothetical protein